MLGLTQTEEIYSFGIIFANKAGKNDAAYNIWNRSGLCTCISSFWLGQTPPNHVCERLPILLTLAQIQQNEIILSYYTLSLIHICQASATSASILNAYKNSFGGICCQLRWQQIPPKNIFLLLCVNPTNNKYALAYQYLPTHTTIGHHQYSG